MKYACAALCAAVLVLGWLYHRANSELADTKTELAAARAVNEENARVVARLERSMEITDGVMAGWNADRTTLSQIRATTRQTIREAMKNEVFKVWASGAVPADAWGVLREAAGEDGARHQAAPGSPDAGLPGNAHSGERK